MKVGHDGLGDFYGYNLVNADTDQQIPFEEIQQKTDTIPPEHIEGAKEYGIGFLTADSKSIVWDHLGIDPNGIEGKEGPRGPAGPAGPVGPAGLNWKSQYSDSVTYSKDDAVGYAGASYFCLKEVTGIAPLPKNEYWALLASQGAVGPEGPRGPAGENGKDADFDVTALSNEDLENLRVAIKRITPPKFWAYRVKMQTSNGASKRWKLGDMNLDLIMTTTSADSVKFEAARNNDKSVASFMIRRLTVYGATSLEGTYTPNYRPITLTTSNYLIDDYDYADARSYVEMHIIDSTNRQFYNLSIMMNVESDGRYLYMEVNKAAPEGFTDV